MLPTIYHLLEKLEILIFFMIKKQEKLRSA